MSFTCEKVETLTEGATKCVLGIAIAFSRESPDLVCVVVGARPYLHDGAVALGAIGEIETLTWRERVHISSDETQARHG